MLLTNVVVSETLFQRIFDPGIKPVPVAVRVNVEPGTTVEGGASDVRTGTGLPTMTIRLLDGLPPGAGLVTVIRIVPDEVRYSAGIEVVNEVELTKVVGSGVPFQRIVAPTTNRAPVVVSVTEGDPIGISIGVTAVRAGVGLTMASDSPFEVPPLGEGLTAVIIAVPVVVM